MVHDATKRQIKKDRDKAKLNRHKDVGTELYENPMGKNGGLPRLDGEMPRYNVQENPERKERRIAAEPAEVPHIRLSGISKRFGKVHANKDITLDIHSGRILALLGENGAGKSTLMSILAGRYHPDSGSIEIDGVAQRFSDSKDAIEAGIGMVYQHFMLVDTMTVAQNVLLGQEGGFWVNPREMEERVEALSKRYNLDIDPTRKISELSMGERQRVEILKLLHRDSGVLIFDEPTAVLTPPEIVQLFDALDTMAEQGKAIVFISHKLEEVMNMADDIAVLRKGEIVDRMIASEVSSKAELASRMVGREVLLEVGRVAHPLGDVVMEIKDLSGEKLDKIDLTLRKGEIVAVVGVAGNGQKELVETISGLRKPEYGEISLLDKPWKDFYDHVSWKDSLSYIPEDRLGLATCPDLDMVDNVLLTTRQGFTKGILLETNKALRKTGELVRDFNVQPPQVRTQASKLSGGNLQKLVIAREFFRCPQIIVAEQPTQGLDISATEEVWKQLLAARENSGILLVTGDLSEALQLADRLAVMFNGRFMDIIPAIDENRLEDIGLLMAGVEV